MIEIFKTNIQKPIEAQIIKQLINEHFPNCRVDFDLEDCDKILRIDTDDLINDSIKEIIQSQGYSCEVLV